MQDNHTFSRSKVSMAVALALASYGTAHAQESSSSAAAADEPRIEEVVTTGYRRSLEDTAALKMDSESIIEAVSAEEIGKLPDVSIAESLARLPGLTAQRLNGRGQVISVRGLAPDFTTALLNGREQVTAGDNRGVEFDQYPSEVLSRVVVYKTPDAALVGQGLAGTADLQTISPLEHGEKTMAANVRYQWLENKGRGGDDSGVRYSATYIDQFADDTVGLVLAVADMSSPSQADWFEAWGYADGPDGSKVVGGAKGWVQASELDRTGLVGVLEYEPNDAFRATVDMFYGGFDEFIGRRGLEIPLQWSSASLDSYSIEGGLVTSGTYSNVKPVIRNDADFRNSDMRSVGAKGTWDAGNSWSMTFDANHSSINRTDQILETYSGTGSWANGQNMGATDTLDFVQTPGGVIFSNGNVNYGDPNQLVLTDPQGWGGSRWGDGGQVGFNKFFTIDDTINQLRVSTMGDVEWGFVSNVEFGVNVTQREKDMDNFEEILTTGGGVYDPVTASVSGNVSSIPFPSSVPVGTADLGYAGIPAVIAYNPVAMYNSGVYQKINFVHRDVTIKSWNIQEDVTTAYGKFGFDSTWGKVPVSGNFGLQVVHTDQTGRSESGTGEFNSLVETNVSGGRSYYDFLPSFNVTFEVGDDSYLRVAGARTLARPRMDDLRPGLVFSYDATKAAAQTDPNDLDQSPWGGGGGNPELEPWIANAFDISYEKYFEERSGYLSVAAFYKDLETYIYNQTVPYDFSAYPFEGPRPLTFTGLATTPQNGTGGSIQGIEFAISLPGATISETLDGFGAFFTYSYTDSDIDYDGPSGGGASGKIPGLSEQVGNITLYYERAGFSGRVSGRYRSDFLGEVSGFANGRDFRTVESETVVDAQLSYMFQSGPAEGMSVLLQGYNLTDEPFVTFENDDPRQVRNFQSYGRSYLVGLSYSF